MFELTTGAVAQTMTSTEIAKLTGKEKKHIHRDIKEQLLLGLYGIDGPKMDLIDIKGISVILADNGFWSEVNLDRYHTDILVSGYEVKYRAAIVKRWHELEEVARKGISNTRMLANIAVQMADAEERQLALEAENAHLKKQVKVVEAKADAVLSQSGFYSVLGFCKLHELPVTLAQAAGHSRGVNKLCQRDGIERQQTVDPRFGKIYIYPELQLFEYFSNKGLLEI